MIDYDEFKGLNGVIRIDDSYVVIERKKGLTTFFNKKRLLKIDYQLIKQIKYKSGNLTNGYIAIIIKESRVPHTIFGAVGNDYTVIFRREKNGEAKRFLKKIKEYMYEKNKYVAGKR